MYIYHSSCMIKFLHARVVILWIYLLKREHVRKFVELSLPCCIFLHRHSGALGLQDLARKIAQRLNKFIVRIADTFFIYLIEFHAGNLMPEMPHAGHDHREAVLVGGLY